LSQEEEHTRLMRLRELSDENKSKSHGNMARSASAYGDTKYVRCVKLLANGRNISQNCWANNVGSCCVRVGSGVQTDATTPTGDPDVVCVAE